MSIGIWNSLDELALYIGIDRLPKEDDDSFRERIYQVSRYMYKNDSYSLIKSISAQCGVKVKPVIQIDSDNYFKISIDYDYFVLETDNSYIRKFIGYDQLELYEIIDMLNDLQDISVTRLYDPRVMLGADKDVTIKHIIKNTNVKISNSYINTTSAKLSENILKGMLEFEDTENYNREVTDLQSIKAKGDYFVDYENGLLQSFSCSDIGQIIKYKHIEKPFIVECSELAFTPINQYFKYGLTKDSLKVIEFLLHRNTWS